MRPNRLRVMWAQKQTAFGAFCNTPSTFSAELFADVGYDFVCIDCQHGLIGYDAMWPMVQAIRFSDATALVRVPTNTPSLAGQALDAGAEGVLFPMVNSRADAELAVSGCRYSPDGVRSFGPVRSGMLVGSDPTTANRENLCIVMIETVRAVENADSICSTPGVDAVYIGPADLAVDMGLGMHEWFVNPAHLEAIAAIRGACERNDIAAGLHTTGGEAGRRFASEGFTMATVVMDTGGLRTFATAQLAEARDGTGTRPGLYG